MRRSSMTIIETIAPIFIVIVFGYALKRRGFLSEGFFAEANRFVFIFPLPFLIFTGIIKANVKEIGLLSILSITVPTFATLCIACIVAAIAGLRGGRLGTFVQTAFHGNVTYVGLAVIFYLLGEAGLERGSLLVGILILLNNSLAVLVLSLSSGVHRNIPRTLFSILTTPVIIATFVGMSFLFIGIKIPDVLMKSVTIVANIALPMALIIIGGSISTDMLRKTFRPAVIATVLKLIVLPGIAVAFCHFFSISYEEALPAIILLATPTAITSYIMARELAGDAELASGAVTLTTLASPFVYVGWMWILKMA